MNPIVITGIMAVTVASFGMMVSFAGEQAQLSDVAGEAARMQAERVREEVSVGLDGGRLVVENGGSVPVRILEVRVLDDSGRIVLRQAADAPVAAAQAASLPMEPGVAAAAQAAAGQGAQ